TNTQNLQTLYVRVYSATTGCESFTTLTLRVNPNPTVKDPPDMESCDTDNPGSGFAEFDLTEHEGYMLDGATGLTVTYHLNLPDAEAGIDEILNPETYTNTQTPNQIIYVRVTNTATGCYTIVELLLIVNALPDVSDLQLEYVVCEAGNTGFGEFDLTTIRSGILDGFGADAPSYRVTFYEVQGDEDIPQSAIPEAYLSQYQNTVAYNQTLYIRVEHIASGCFVTGEVELEVLEGALIGVPGQVLEVCEDDLGSGVGTFDLTQLDMDILAGQDPNAFTLTYHPTQGDANNNANIIGNPGAYQSPTATIYARVTNNDTGCYETVAVELLVVPQPVIAFEDGYRICVDEFGNVIIEESGPTSPPTIDTGLNSNDYAFVWELDGGVLFGETGSSIVAGAPGVYTVTVTHITTGCTASESATVIASSPPLQYSAQAGTGAFAGTHTIAATASGLGTYIFKLDDGPYQSSGIFNNVSPGTHIVTITDENGCGTVTVEVGIIDYPLYFTPNDDGYHDTW
ncbi:MAG TPA: hypothetical protein VLO13_03320, partial [Halomonas sp.]|nr:hypothetical protein [Halomonas sp.]